MSGGVDSSVAAAILRNEGYEVIGCFMRLGSPGDELIVKDGDGCNTRSLKVGHQGCCSVGDAADARLVAAILDVPFYVCNFREDFGRIIRHFVAEYADGRTPNPCIRCNDWLKFGKLKSYAQQLGADLIASGHYARIEQRDGRPRLMRGLDESKDQSYVLFGAASEALDHMLLPIGGMHKSEVRERAKALGLPVFDKPDSQEICFVPDNDYAGFVERQRPELRVEGKIIDTAGREVGRHQGHHRFTIGQRRGVGVAAGSPIYVVDKRTADNTIVVGSREELYFESCIGGEAQWFVEPAAEWTPCRAQHRYNSDACLAEYRVNAPCGVATYSGRTGRFEVRFVEPQFAVAPGQAIVLYERDEPSLVLGGGWIERAERKGKS